MINFLKSFFIPFFIIRQIYCQKINSCLKVQNNSLKEMILNISLETNCIEFPEEITNYELFDEEIILLNHNLIILYFRVNNCNLFNEGEKEITFR